MSITTLIGAAPLVRTQPTPSAPPDAHHRLDHIVARVHGRYPAASEALVQRCVDEAAAHFDGVGVDLYLPILIERRSSLAVRAALTAATDQSST